jgi:hypothetical protein
VIDVVVTAVGAGILATALWFGHRAVTAGMLYRSVSAAGDGTPPALVDGETVAVEGTVNVDDQPPLSGSLPIEAERPVGAYVWRLKESESGEYNLDADEAGADMNLITYASGFEFGTVRIDDGRRTVHIDMDWLTETHDSADIETVSRDWRVSTLLSKRSWISPYIHLRDHWAVSPVADVDDIPGADAAGESPDDEYFEVKAILDGGTLAVRGEVAVDGGVPVLRGSDETPLLLSDQGFASFGGRLRRQVLKYGLASGGFAAVASLVLVNGLGIT